MLTPWMHILFSISHSVPRSERENGTFDCHKMIAESVISIPKPLHILLTSHNRRDGSGRIVSIMKQLSIQQLQRTTLRDDRPKDKPEGVDTVYS